MILRYRRKISTTDHNIFPLNMGKPVTNNQNWLSRKYPFPIFTLMHKNTSSNKKIILVIVKVI